MQPAAPRGLLLALAALLAAPAGAGEASTLSAVTPVQKVIQLLEGML
eukprot:CAMPEP_0168393466 /NCGR_PEP_ID=MMETSP0228-20121227/19032_1 /TAXON_ID=133427 /ORGANISM="Protoceratium reticulatum, Strain CCCM 535 (=CCMP 1889)" /LENGTH=46 /DNA_ID= /DNA_START= /DNA_END= /DNA_ORIENTATION=